MRHRPGICLKGLKKTTKIIILLVVQDEIRNEHLQNKSLQLYEPAR
jgi:hypothetical protein